MNEPDFNEAVAEVIPFASGGWLEEPLVYKLPLENGEQVQAGCLVRIPIRSRYEIGMVYGLGSRQQVPESKLKYIQQLLYQEPVITPDLMELAFWMQSYYAEPIESVLETMIPAPIRKGIRPKTRKYLAVAAARPEPAELASLEKRAPRQHDLYQFLSDQSQPVPKSPILERLKVSSSSCQSLLDRGWLVESVQVETREAYDDIFSSRESEGGGRVNLNEEQVEVTRSLISSLEKKAFQVHLLHGVTGSGKTEVYLQAAEQVLREGGGILFLVPEIALAPQTVGRLRSRLQASGVRTVVWHSFLSDGERFDAWQALASGEARVVVGARSAVFAPVQNLRLIIVDEEHEPSYKQEDAPRYHGRDVAVYRAKILNTVCVLGSATPSLESLFNANQGKYILDRIKNRVDSRKLPTLHLVDMRLEFLKNREKGKGPLALSSMLVDKLRDRLEKQEQSILFLNRRGYATSLLCMGCGWVAESPNSSVTMTYHRVDDRLKCHLSGHEESAPVRCPQCGKDSLRKKGIGTQRVEQAVQAIFPRARVVRMDADVMTRKNLFRKILDDFRIGKIDILIGTQMIAKGLDFPNVTLVGLVDADLSMHMPDFRAAERTFQLIVQVSGRAGRGDGHGEVVIQTFTPHSGPLLFARQRDFDGFLEEELIQRKEFHYPPYRHLIRHIFRGPNPDKVAFFAEQFARLAEKRIGDRAEVRGPAPAPLEKIKDAYRFHIWYFTNAITRVVPELEKMRQEFPSDRQVLDLLDVDPVHLL